MRMLDFQAMRDLVLLVDEHPSGIRANQLEKRATAERVLLRHDGQPYTRSVHYRYRRTLERLGLLEKKDRQLVVNHRNPDTRALVSHGNYRQPLPASEKEALANAALRNEDCHNAFFKYFLPGGPVDDVRGFVETARPVETTIRRGRCRSSGRSNQLVVRPAGTPKRILVDPSERAAHSALSRWCADQLGFVEITYRADGTYTAYPKHVAPRLTDQELAAAMFAKLGFVGEWATIRIPDMVLSTGITHRVSVDEAKKILARWVVDHYDLVDGIPTRVGFITDGTPDSLHALALKSYLQPTGRGAHLSHLRTHRKLRGRIGGQVSTL